VSCLQAMAKASRRFFNVRQVNKTNVVVDVTNMCMTQSISLPPRALNDRKTSKVKAGIIILIYMHLV